MASAKMQKKGKTLCFAVTEEMQKEGKALRFAVTEGYSLSIALTSSMLPSLAEGTIPSRWHTRG